MDPKQLYDNPLVERYASRAMAELWGARRKFGTWRRLWLALAEAQYELGLPADDGVTPRIRPEQLAELRAHLDDIDFERAAAVPRGAAPLPSPGGRIGAARRAVARGPGGTGCAEAAAAARPGSALP